MTVSTRTRSLTVGCALAVAASGVVGGGMADAVSDTVCAPTTRTLDTLTDSTPLALSPRGHVVAEEGDPGAGPGLWLHRPNGTKTTITFDNGFSPSAASDVSGRGVTVGTQGQNQGAIIATTAWTSRGGHAAFLPMPTRVEPSYLAVRVNYSGVIAGVATNAPFTYPGGTAFSAVPLVWPDRTSNPVELSMPTDTQYVAFERGAPLISITNDGTVSAVLKDLASPATVLARWTPGVALPSVDLLPAAWHPVAVAGRWVVGRGGTFTGDMFVWSPTGAVTLHPDHAMFGAMDVSAGGTYFGVVEAGTAVDVEAIVGRGTGVPRVAGSFTDTVDVSGNRVGQLLVDTAGATQVVSCALESPPSTHVDVTSVS